MANAQSATTSSLTTAISFRITDTRKEWEARGETTIRTIFKPHTGGATEKKGRADLMSDDPLCTLAPTRINAGFGRTGVRDVCGRRLRRIAHPSSNRTEHRALMPQAYYCGGFLAGNEVDGGGYSGQMQFNQIQQWSGWPPATMAPLLIAVREARVGVPAGSSPFKGSHH